MNLANRYGFNFREFTKDLYTDLCLHHQTAFSFYSAAFLDSDSEEDLRRKLDKELDKIIELYNSYVNAIRESLVAKEIDADKLSSDLMNISAFNHTEKKRTLLFSQNTELNEAETITKIFKLLSTDYASFVSFEIFQKIIHKYQLDDGQEEFKYPEYLETYVKKHRISEFVKINPLLIKFTDASKKVIIKIDTTTTSRLSKVKNLKTEFADILNLESAALRLVDIEEGCVVVTFLLPTHIADAVFNKHTTFTGEQLEKLQALDILWLKCNGYTCEVITLEDCDGRIHTDSK